MTVEKLQNYKQGSKTLLSINNIPAVCPFFIMRLLNNQWLNAVYALLSIFKEVMSELKNIVNKIFDLLTSPTIATLIIGHAKIAAVQILDGHYTYTIFYNR